MTININAQPSPPGPSGSLDPLERHDRWRQLWRALTSDVLLTLLAVIMLIAALAAALTPQHPGPAVADAQALNGWNAAARLASGGAFEALSSLGLLDVHGTPFFVIISQALIALALLRLADRLWRIARSRQPAGDLWDEPRARVTDQAPPMAVMAERLRARRYNAILRDDAIHASRAPRAEFFSALMCAGLALAGAGMLLNNSRGWRASSVSLADDLPATLPGGTQAALSTGSSLARAELQIGEQKLTLAEGGSAATALLRVTLRQLSADYRASAHDAQGAALLIRTSNYLSPTKDARVSFGGERTASLAVPDTQLVLTLIRGDDPAQTGTRVQATSIGSASQVADLPLTPHMQIAQTSFDFAPALSAVIDADYHPGSPLLWAGLALAALGALAARFFPMRRVLVRHHGHWTEVFAAGRGVRADTQAILNPDPPPAKPV